MFELFVFYYECANFYMPQTEQTSDNHTGRNRTCKGFCLADENMAII